MASSADTDDQPVDESAVVGDIVGKIKQAIDDEVAWRRRQRLPITVDRGAGVEVLSD
jgi:hypothetical protein